MPRTKAAAYRSSACQIGTHHECAYSSPATAPLDIPVIYEACACPCHEPATAHAPTEATA
ncbi:hypothetical protein ACIQ62_01340 [Streptomyces sp. NPDC096319]|uniref:hypothetical protein n=1 Tax=Streptomyces sp. NPDC096319 TaxID=3366084 RepID=UPI00382DDC2F